MLVVVNHLRLSSRNKIIQSKRNSLLETSGGEVGTGGGVASSENYYNIKSMHPASIFQ